MYLTAFSNGNRAGCLVIMLLVMLCRVGFAQKPAVVCTDTLAVIKYPVQKSTTLLNGALQVYEDTSRKLTYAQAKQAHFEAYASLPKKLNHQYVYWGKISIRNQTNNQEQWYLDIGGKNGVVKTYIPQENNHILMKKSGMYVPVSQKSFKETTSSIIRLKIPHQVTQTFYFRIATLDGRTPKVRLTLINTDYYQKFSYLKKLIQGVFQGVFWLMMLYNLLLYLTTHRKSYLFYSCYLLSITWYFLYFHGLLRQYIMPELPQLHQYIWILSASGMSVFYFSFARAFLGTRQLIPKVDVWIRYTIIFRICLMSLELVYYHLFTNFTLVNTLSLSSGAYDTILSFVLFVALYRSKDPVARYFITGALVFSLTTIVCILIYPYSQDWYILLYQSGAVLEILLFSLGLGYQVRFNEREKREAQQKVIEQLSEKDTLQHEHAQELEQKVAERTQQVVQQQEELKAQHSFMLEKNQLLEHKTAKIQSSIKAARMIQDAVLPYDDKMAQLLKNYFIFYSPKDVVSGDFYWINQVDNKVVMVVADCTGHGVPGAFMTLIGNTLLDKIVQVWQVTNPAQILENLHQEINKVLKTKQSGNVGGMEAAVITMNATEVPFQSITFAGAKSALYLIHTETQVLERVKGTRRHLGEGRFQPKQSFTCKEVSLTSGDMLYLGSDGYQDQNNLDREKFGTKRLQELLSNIAYLPLPEQKQILSNNLEAFMQGVSQRDDILIVGIRV